MVTNAELNIEDESLNIQYGDISNHIDGLEGCIGSIEYCMTEGWPHFGGPDTWMGSVGSWLSSIEGQMDEVCLYILGKI